MVISPSVNRDVDRQVPLSRAAPLEPLERWRRAGRAGRRQRLGETYADGRLEQNSRDFKQKTEQIIGSICCFDAEMLLSETWGSNQIELALGCELMILMHAHWDAQTLILSNRLKQDTPLWVCCYSNVFAHIFLG